MISCSQYDYVEIACMFNYPLRLDLTTGIAIEGKALDTKRNEANQECIEVESAGSKKLIVLDQISQMTVLIDNPHFSTVNFNTAV